MIEQLQRLPTEIAYIGGWRRHVLRSGMFQAVFFLREVEGEMRMCAVRVALPGTEQSRLLQAQVTGRSYAAEPALLPLPASVGMIASRDSENGTRLCEILENSGTLESLVKHWAAHGWSARRNPASLAGESWLCERAAASISVQSIGDPDEHGILLVVRSDAPTEGEPKPALHIEQQ